MAQKVTGWFTKAVKPVHVGKYEVKLVPPVSRIDGSTIKTVKAKWDGSRWRMPVGVSFMPKDLWRGVAKA